MLLTRRPREQSYSDPTLEDHPTQVIYISGNIQNIIGNYGGKQVLDFIVLSRCFPLNNEYIDLYWIFKLSAGTWLASMTLNTMYFWFQNYLNNITKNDKLLFLNGPMQSNIPDSMKMFNILKLTLEIYRHRTVQAGFIVLMINCRLSNCWS